MLVNDELYNIGLNAVLGGITMDFKLIREKIEHLKQLLDELIELHGMQSKEVLKCSQELDVFICNSYKIKSK